MVPVTIVVLFGMVSVGRCLVHQVMVASLMVDGRAGDVRNRLNCPNQQQDNSQHPQQPMRRRSSCCAGRRDFHAKTLEAPWSRHLVYSGLPLLRAKKSSEHRYSPVGLG
jgi:hypothetical protein